MKKTNKRPKVTHNLLPLPARVGITFLLAVTPGLMGIRPVKAIDRNIKLNQLLWLLSEKMAELKRTETVLSVVPA